MPIPNTNTNLGVGNVDIIYAIQNTKAAQTNSITLSSGSTTSTLFNLSSTMVTGFQFPAGYDGGNITFLGSDSETGIYTSVYDSNGNEVSAVVTTGSTLVSLVGNSLQGLANVPYIKIKTASAVGDDRVIKVMSKG